MHTCTLSRNVTWYGMNPFFQRRETATHLSQCRSLLRSRPNSELDYLKHLQGIIQVLHKYDILELFIAFVETIENSPTCGTDSFSIKVER